MAVFEHAVFDTLEKRIDPEQGKDYNTVIESFPEIDYTLIYRHTKFEPWVAAWGYNEEKGYWGQGHYFDKATDAIQYIGSVYKAKEGQDNCSSEGR